MGDQVMGDVAPLKPNRCEKFMVHNPCSMIAVVLMTIIVVFVGGFAMNGMPKMADGEAGFKAWIDPEQQKLDAFLAGKSKLGTTSNSKKYTIQSQELAEFTIYYEATRGSVFTVANLKRIRKLEDKLMKISGIKDYCLRVEPTSKPFAFQMGSGNLGRRLLGDAPELGVKSLAKCLGSSSILNYVYSDADQHSKLCQEGFCNQRAAFMGGYSETVAQMKAVNKNASFAQTDAAGSGGGLSAVGTQANCPGAGVHPTNPTGGNWGNIPCDSNVYDFSLRNESIEPMDQATLDNMLQDWFKKDCQVDAPFGDDSYDPYAGYKQGLRRKYISDNFTCDSDGKPELSEAFLKSSFKFGGPFKHGADCCDRTDAAFLTFKKWFDGTFTGEWGRILSEEGMDATDASVRAYIYDTKRLFNGVELGKGSLDDGLLAVGSFGFVFLYMWFQTGSVFLSACGMTEIILALPLSLFCWIVVGRQEYFNSLMLLGLFIILGIGADDVFVFCDAWRQSEAQPKHISGSLETRLAWAYRRSVSAMAVTSTTTFCAFASAAITPVPIMLSFGVFAGLLVLFNFVLVITFFPACVLVHHKYMRKLGCSCFGRGRVKPDPESSRRSTQVDATSTGSINKEKADDTPPEPHSQAQAALAEAKVWEPKIQHVDIDKLGAAERFFSLTYTKFLQNRVVRLVAIPFFAVLTVTSTSVAAVYLVPSEEPLRLFQSVDYYVNRKKVVRESFASPAGGVKLPVSVVWGISETDTMDRTGIDMQETVKMGVPKYNADFKVDDATQLEVVEVCEEGRNYPDLVAHNVDSGEAEVYCFMELFRDYLLHTNRTFPCGDKFLDYAQEAAFPTYIRQTRQLTGMFGQPFSTQSWFLLDDEETRVLMLFVSFNSTVPLEPISFEVGDGIMTAWDNVLEKTTNGVKSKFHYNVLWSWTITQRYLLSSATTGVFLSFGLTFLVVLVSTMNWFLTLICLLAIFGVCMSVFMLMVAVGWSIGVLESICMIIVVGMSVDYSVHLVHSYNHSPYPTRLEKTRTALTEMGVSVLGGAVTTFGASVFLFMAEMTFFYQFGLFIGMTIGLSCVFALVCLMAVLITIGPEGTRVNGNHVFGDLRCLRKRDQKGVQVKVLLEAAEEGREDKEKTVLPHATP